MDQPRNRDLEPSQVAFGVSAAVGIAFGVVPALRAAKLDPVAALRSE
jgi:putative ABC transport system permease protein